MRMRALFRAGFRLTAVSGLANFAAALLGAQGGWLDWALSLMFLAGVTDMAIAAGYSALHGARDDDGRSRLAVEADGAGVRVWWGDDARERREEYLEERDRGTSRRALYAQPDSGLRWAYPAGLSYRVPWADPGVSLREAEQFWRALSHALSAPWPPQKRLAPPLSAGWRDDRGLDFPEPAVYSLVDRYGERTPPFPVHFRMPDEVQALLDGVRMTTVNMEYHTDARHRGCPVCETWELEWGAFHD